MVSRFWIQRYFDIFIAFDIIWEILEGRFYIVTFDVGYFVYFI